MEGNITNLVEKREIYPNNTELLPKIILQDQINKTHEGANHKRKAHQTVKPKPNTN